MQTTGDPLGTGGPFQFLVKRPYPVLEHFSILELRPSSAGFHLLLVFRSHLAAIKIERCVPLSGLHSHKPDKVVVIDVTPQFGRVFVYEGLTVLIDEPCAQRQQVSDAFPAKMPGNDPDGVEFHVFLDWHQP